MHVHDARGLHAHQRPQELGVSEYEMRRDIAAFDQKLRPVNVAQDEIGERPDCDQFQGKWGSPVFREAKRKQAQADGDSTTSNIVTDLAPIDAFVRFEVALGLFDLLPQSWAIQKRDVIGDGRKPVGR